MKLRHWRRNAINGTLTVLLVLVAVQCLSESTGSAQPPRGQAHGRARASSAQTNRQLTHQELVRLRRQAVLPERRTSHAPVGQLSGPAVGLLPTASLRNLTQFYRVPIALHNVRRWFDAHRPTSRLHVTAERRAFSHRKTTEEFVEYTAHDSTAYLEPSLEFSVKPAANHSTIWRVDEMALWLATRPKVDTRHGHSMRVTIHAGCPASDANRDDVTNPAADLDRHLLPPASPSRALICTYSGDGSADIQPAASHRPRRT